MSKKLKLPFMQLHKEIYEILSLEELKSIVGGLGDWGTDQEFLNNVNEMISTGMLNYTGSASYDSGFVSVGGSSGSSGSGIFNGFNFGSGNGSGANFMNYYTGSNGSAPLFSFGSRVGSTPAPFIVNGSFGSASFNKLGSGSMEIILIQGSNKLIFQYNNGQAKVSFIRTF
jgi:hypothetical protein